MVQCPPTPQTGFQGSKAVAHFNTRLVQSCWTGLDSPVSSHSPFPGKGGEAYTHKIESMSFPFPILMVYLCGLEIKSQAAKESLPPTVPLQKVPAPRSSKIEFPAANLPESLREIFVLLVSGKEFLAMFGWKMSFVVLHPGYVLELLLRIFAHGILLVLLGDVTRFDV